MWDVRRYVRLLTSSSSLRTHAQITYIDGDKGQLLYRGYPIEQLAENGDALDV